MNDNDCRYFWPGSTHVGLHTCRCNLAFWFVKNKHEKQKEQKPNVKEQSILVDYGLVFVFLAGERRWFTKRYGAKTCLLFFRLRFRVFLGGGGEGENDSLVNKQISLVHEFGTPRDRL